MANGVLDLAVTDKMKPLRCSGAILARIGLAANGAVGIREIEPEVVLVLFRGGLKVGGIAEDEVESAHVAACQREPRLIALRAIVGGEQGLAVAVLEREGMRLATRLPAFNKHSTARRQVEADANWALWFVRRPPGADHSRELSEGVLCTDFSGDVWVAATSGCADAWVVI